jgi:hypothetical protein
VTVYRSESKAPTPKAIWAGLGGLAGAIAAIVLDFISKTASTTWEEALTVVLPAILALIGAYFAPAAGVVEKPPPAAR